MSGVRPQQEQNLLDPGLAFGVRGRPGVLDEGFVAEVGGDLFRQFRRRGHEVGQACLDGAAGHAVELRGGRLLHEDNSRALLDGCQAERSVASHPRQNHADGQVMAVVGQGTQEEVHRQAQPARLRRGAQVQYSMQDGHVLVGRDHIDAVGPDLGVVFGLHDRHGGAPLEQRRQYTLARRVQVLNDNKGHADRFRHVAQELLQGFKASCGGANADDGERGSGADGFCAMLRRTL